MNLNNNLIIVFLIWTLLLSIYVFSSKVTGQVCGYESCPKSKDGYLNVHLVPHTHDDLGWLKTVDQYYYGAKNFIQQASVKYLLDSVIDELQKDPSRRFIHVETGFFWRWWTNQNPPTQKIVKNLINSGQLEFINGGWCMNDEATTHYNAIIDQMSLGLRYLNDTFGKCALPRVSWQIDPFGHSREQASLNAQIGFDGLFFGRLDYQDKFNRELRQNMETIWNGSPNNLGKNAWLFTGVLRNGYNPPDGFCFDITCGDEPIMDDPKLLGYNLDQKIRDFINASRQWAAPYRTNHILMTMGSDFQYLSARAWYDNLGKLILRVNELQQTEQSKIHLMYSTPSCYLQELHKAGLKWSVKTDDFFPYASDPNAFWTGYFTSRPSLKYYIHQTNNFLQICKQMAVFLNGTQTVLNKVFKLAEPVAVAQHHDAVAGTAKQHVTDDYAFRLSLGIQSCEQVISSAFMSMQYQIYNKHSSNNNNMNPENFQNSISFNPDDINFCHNLNISSCPASESMNEFILSVYNPLARQLTDTNLRIPVSTQYWKVQSDSGEIPSETVDIPEPVLKIPGRETSTAYFELVFPVASLAPLSVTQFKISRVRLPEIVRKSRGRRSINSSMAKAKQNSVGQSSDILIQNSKGVSFTLDASNGLLKKIGRYNSVSGETVSINLTQNFYFYQGASGNNMEFQNRSSGAYIFRPTRTQPIPIATQANYRIIKGAYVTEVHQTFSKWTSQIIRLYENSNTIEFEWLIGPIPIGDEIGKEIVTRYSTDLESKGTFFTDANGREILKRKRNSRETWTYQIHEPVAGNYYPVNSRIILTETPQDLNSADVGKTLIVLNDRAQGGSSMNDGELELMIHRRLLHDDAFGVGEALNETQFGQGLVVRGKHWVVLAGGETGIPVSIHRPLAQEIYRSPLYTIQDSSTFYTNDEIVNNNLPKSQSFNEYGRKLSSVLPANIHLLTLEKLSSKQYLLRLEHIYEVNEDQSGLSDPVSIPIKGLQNIFNFVKIRETTLGGNQWIDEAKRFDWTPQDDDEYVEDNQAEFKRVVTKYKEGDTNIIIIPMEIKTFIYYTN